MTNDNNPQIPTIPYASNGVGHPLILHRAENGYRCMNLGCPCNASLVHRAWEGDTGKMARIEREQQIHNPACAVCGKPDASGQCWGCKYYFCGQHFLEHMQDNASILGDSREPV